jgi:hypothetical protein
MRATIYTKIQTRPKDRGGKAKLPKDPSAYPSNEEVASWFRHRGWELPANAALLDSGKSQTDLEPIYVAQAKEISLAMIRST